MVPTRVHSSLNLDKRLAAPGGNSLRKRKVGVAAVAPFAKGRVALAGFVPSLDKVVMDVDDGRTGELDVNIVILVLANMTW